MVKNLKFKKINEVISEIKPLDKDIIEWAQKRLDNLTKPKGSLGALEDTAKKIVAITGRNDPMLKNKVVFTMAADHGVADEGVSAYPKEVTREMVYNFLSGGAAVNVLAGHAGARVVVVDMGVAGEIRSQRSDVRSQRTEDRRQMSDVRSQSFMGKKIAYGTKNMVKGPAMTIEEAETAILNGIEVFEEELKNGIDLAATGDMGIANTTASSAIVSVITGRKVEDVTGRGTGVDDKTLTRKIEVIKKAIKVNNPDKNDAIDVLSKVGGFEIGGIAGIILASAANRVPVIIDGFISGAAAVLAYKLAPLVRDYMIAGHSSVEKGHRILLDFLGIKPLLDLDLRLGEGTGAVLAMNIVEASIKILTEMSTFEAAGVSEKL